MESIERIDKVVSAVCQKKTGCYMTVKYLSNNYDTPVTLQVRNIPYSRTKNYKGTNGSVERVFGNIVRLKDGELALQAVIRQKSVNGKVIKEHPEVQNIRIDRIIYIK